MAKRKGLGRGLGALIEEAPAGTGDEAGGVRHVPLRQIKPSRWQPRRSFDAGALEELADSIRERGVVQPLLVRRADAWYELIAGERRFRAAKVAGLESVPILLLDASDQEALELALVENLQREDLNPIEEAEGLHALAERFRLTQEEVARLVGKARASVANTLRLLDLGEAIRRLVAEGALSAGHAKVLLQVADSAERETIARRAVREQLSVRALEKVVEIGRRPPKKRRASRIDVPTDHIAYLTDTLHRHFGTGVRIDPCRTLANGKKAKGTIAIDFYSAEELDRLLAMLGVSDEL